MLNINIIILPVGKRGLSDETISRAAGSGRCTGGGGASSLKIDQIRSTRFRAGGHPSRVLANPPLCGQPWRIIPTFFLRAMGLCTRQKCAKPCDRCRPYPPFLALHRKYHCTAHRYGSSLHSGDILTISKEITGCDQFSAAEKAPPVKTYMNPRRLPR